MPALAHAKEPLDGCGLLLARVNEPSGLFSSAGSHANEREPLDGCGLLLARGIRGSKPRPPRDSSVVEDWWDPVRGGQRGLARGKRSCCAARLRSGRIGRPSCAEIGRKALPFRGLDAPGPRQAGCLAAFAQLARRGQGPCRPPLPGKCVQIGEGRPQRAILPARSPPDASRPCSRSADPAAAGGRGSGGRERREAGRGCEKGTVPFSRWPEGRRSTAA